MHPSSALPSKYQHETGTGTTTGAEIHLDDVKLQNVF